MKQHRVLAILIGSLLLSLVAGLGDASADARVALVVGNGRYLNTPALENPGNDATDVAAALIAIGFKVTVRIDSSKRDFDQALAQFSRDAKTADAALFYYAGHGMQFQGRNYLMPVDAELRDEVSLRYEMTAVDEVKDALRTSSGIKILVLDSCRDNPLANQFMRSIAVSTRDVPRVQGFAREISANGMVIVYSTQANEVAHDGVGRNSPFSAAFLQEMREPGIEVGALFRRVESDVFKATGGQQSPELSISMVPEYYMNRGETDQSVWAQVRNGADVEALEAFLARFPHSFYAPDASARLTYLRGGAAPPAAADKSGEAREMQLAARLATAEAEKARLDEELAKLAKAVTEPTKLLRSPEPAASVKPVQPAGADEKPTTVASLGSDGAANITLLPAIREQLRRLGCYDGGDLDWAAPALKLGVSKYVRFANLANPAPSPDEVLLGDMKRRGAGLCHPDCSARETLIGSRCVAKSCPPGAPLSRSGLCVQLRPAARIAHEADDDESRSVRLARPRPHARAQAPVGGGGGRCFSFNGSQYCE